MTKKAWLAALLNFVLMGAGYIYNGRRVYLGVGLTAVAVYATWFENFVLKVQAPELFNYMFGMILVLNLFLAIDGYRESNWINSSSKK